MSNDLFTTKYFQVPIVPIVINDNEYMMLVDTGSDHSSLDKQIIDTIDDKIHVGSLETIYTASGANESDGVNIYKINFICADVEMDECFMVENAKEVFDFFLERTGIKLYGIIGSDILMKHQAILDFKQQILIFND